MTLPSLNTGTSTVTISRFFTTPKNRFEYCGRLVEKTFSTMSRLLRSGRLAVSAVTEEKTCRPPRSATSTTPPSPY